MNRIDEGMYLKYFIQYLVNRNYCLLSNVNKGMYETNCKLKVFRTSHNQGKDRGIETVI